MPIGVFHQHVVMRLGPVVADGHQAHQHFRSHRFRAEPRARVKRNIRDALALWLDTDVDGLEITDKVNAPVALAESVARAHELRLAARNAEQEAAAATVDVAGQLREAGLSMREASEILGLSYQRIGQLARGSRARTRIGTSTARPKTRQSA